MLVNGSLDILKNDLMIQVSIRDKKDLSMYPNQSS